LKMKDKNKELEQTPAIQRSVWQDPYDAETVKQRSAWFERSSISSDQCLESTPISEQWSAWQDEGDTIPIEQWSAWSDEGDTIPIEQWSAWPDEGDTIPIKQCLSVEGAPFTGNLEETAKLPHLANMSGQAPIQFAGNLEETAKLPHPANMSDQAPIQSASYCPNCEFELISVAKSANFCPHCGFPIRPIGGKFMLQCELGQGAFGRVYLAQNITSRRMCAVKFLHRDLATRLNIKDKAERNQKIKDFISRFRREVEIMRDTGKFHRYVPRIYGDGMDEIFGYYVAMEYVDSCNFWDALPLEQRKERLLLFGELCRAMSAIHKCGVIHRDLKPENILLSKKANGQWRLLICDFGISKVLGEMGVARTQGVLGSPLYLSPEQISKRHIDHRADIYAMGVILYQMLTNKPPFEGKDVKTILCAHICNPVIPMRSLRPDLDIPESLDIAVCKALAKNANERYDSAMEFWEAIKLCL
jgi:tRNA A-37 threonylcarbamoyl transferase component Bud32